MCNRLGSNAKKDKRGIATAAMKRREQREAIIEGLSINFYGSVSLLLSDGATNCLKQMLVSIVKLLSDHLTKLEGSQKLLQYTRYIVSIITDIFFNNSCGPSAAKKNVTAIDRKSLYITNNSARFQLD